MIKTRLRCLLVFEAHATTLDNEAGLSSGHNDVALSELGKKQAKELGKRYEGQQFDAIFCSDLQRSYKTAEIAFGTAFPIIKDARLRECDYGELTQKPAELVSLEKPKRISTPFTGGESYAQTTERMESFLKELLESYDGKKILVIGHRATQYGIEVFIHGISIEQAVTAPWKWQPGWLYDLKLKK